MSEVPVSFDVTFDGPRVKLTVTAGNRLAPDAQLWGLMPPAQADELAGSLVQMAQLCRQWEGLDGQAHRDVDVHIGTAYTLPAAARPG